MSVLYLFLHQRIVKAGIVFCGIFGVIKMIYDCFIFYGFNYENSIEIESGLNMQGVLQNKGGSRFGYIENLYGCLKDYDHLEGSHHIVQNGIDAFVGKIGSAIRTTQ